METKSKNPGRTRFIKRVVAVDIALLIVAALVSLGLNFGFGVILLFLGILVGGIGGFLGKPPVNSLVYRQSTYTKHPNQTLSEILSYDAEHSLRRSAFENAIAWAGLIAAVLSIPFVIQIMFSK